MNLSVGIIGLPNVGKSTLFNALLKKQAALVANYPFTTIEPNVGVVPVPDPRLEKLAEIVVESAPHPSPLPQRGEGIIPSPLRGEGQDEGERVKPPIVPATVKFVDIAGLVKGANEGAGLGNKFLSHIREVSIIVHVVRAFEDENIIKEGSVDPKTDYEAINTELVLADLQALEKSKVKSEKSKIQVKSQNLVIEKLLEDLNKGIPVRSIRFTEEEKDFVGQLFLITAKPEIVVLNVSEEDYTKEKIPEIIKNYSESLFPVIANQASPEKQSPKNGIASSPRSVDMNVAPRNDNITVICAKIEAELAALSQEEQKEYLKDLGLEHSGLERLIQKAYQTLGLISFLTAGEKEVRAWTIKKGTNAVEAAGEIHTDFIKKFIKAETVPFGDFVGLGGWKKARELGKTRIEGRDYIVCDGDVIEFKIGSS